MNPHSSYPYSYPYSYSYGKYNMPHLYGNMPYLYGNMPYGNLPQYYLLLANPSSRILIVNPEPLRTAKEWYANKYKTDINFREKEKERSRENGRRKRKAEKARSERKAKRVKKTNLSSDVDSRFVKLLSVAALETPPNGTSTSVTPIVLTPKTKQIKVLTETPIINNPRTSERLRRSKRINDPVVSTRKSMVSSLKSMIPATVDINARDPGARDPGTTTVTPPVRDRQTADFHPPSDYFKPKHPAPAPVKRTDAPRLTADFQPPPPGKRKRKGTEVSTRKSNRSKRTEVTTNAATTITKPRIKPPERKSKRTKVIKPPRIKPPERKSKRTKVVKPPRTKRTITKLERKSKRPKPEVRNRTKSKKKKQKKKSISPEEQERLSTELLQSLDLEQYTDLVKYLEEEGVLLRPTPVTPETQRQSLAAAGGTKFYNNKIKKTIRQPKPMAFTPRRGRKKALELFKTLKKALALLKKRGLVPLRSTWTDHVDKGDPNAERLQILLMVILTQNAKDERVIKVVNHLRKLGWFNLDFLAIDDPDERTKRFHQLRHVMNAFGFNIHNKGAGNIMGACYLIKNEFDGEVPEDLDVDTLLSFPGVGYKICMLYYDGIGKPKGVVADTHVLRMAGAFGWSNAGKDETKVAKQLESWLQTKDNMYLINYVAGGLGQLYQNPKTKETVMEVMKELKIEKIFERMMAYKPK